MEYRSLGRTDIKVSALCLGTMTFGEQNSETEAHQLLDMSLEAGVNFIDTAEMYPVAPRAETQGRTEQYIGSWLKARGHRDQVILASKVTGPAEWVDYLRDGHLRFDRKNITSAIEASLQRLQTDYLDLYQLHWPERNTNFFGKLAYPAGEDAHDLTPFLDTLDVLNELVEAGKIRHIGLSNETPWGLMKFLQTAEQHGLPRVVSVQNPYNLLNRSFEVGLSEVALREATGLLAYSPLAFGVLSGKYLHGARPTGARLTLWDRFSRYNSEIATEATQAYVNLAKEQRLDPAQMALAFVTRRRFVTSTIIGATTVEQLESNLASVALKLSDEVLAEIERIHRQYTYPCP